MEVISILKYFDDPRRNHKEEHSLEVIFYITIAAILAGAESWYDVEEFGEFLSMIPSIVFSHFLNRICWNTLSVFNDMYSGVHELSVIKKIVDIIIELITAVAELTGMDDEIMLELIIRGLAAFQSFAQSA
ncbi:transposase family protein [Phocaeicola sartorii]|uniref:transposase family protein n=1 Tax=Phocaeicola sartorii TaxID=671267 RepID=UPI00242C3AAD|nr:transposase family protein [Phocaeicola sartorii]